MKKKYGKRVVSMGLGLLLTLAGLTGCGDKMEVTADGKTKLVLNEVAHSIFYAPMYVAIEEG